MSTDKPEPYPTAVVGGWSQGERLVRDIAVWPLLWTRPYFCAQWPREALTAAIIANGRISDEHALEARTNRYGSIELAEGVHRWTIANEQGYPTVPVVMTIEPDEDAWPTF